MVTIQVYRIYTGSKAINQFVQIKLNKHINNSEIYI